VVPPADVVRHDVDDPYLVVAADKGTATFSDIANSVSPPTTASGWAMRSPPAARSATTTRRWASPRAAPGRPSSATSARWACHTQTTPFTVAGIGDMSGDVFGNGMLLSEQIKLVLAFDHRHIFIDPTPDVRRSFAERQRLFNLPRSSWDDYDKSLISAGRRRVSAHGQVDPAEPRRRVLSSALMPKK
jgi:glutamate dehydrogenase